MTAAPETTIRDDTTARHLRKYSNPNIIHRFTLNRFFDVVTCEIQKLNPQKVLEFGCGEGLFLKELKKRDLYFKSLIGIDLRKDALEIARTLHPDYDFIEKDVFTWDFPKKSFDLVIASQVLEHLPNPEDVLNNLVQYSNKNLLLTVPWEPWFRLMNLIRGRDIIRLGNHPEHINHWGVKTFTDFVSQNLHITTIRTVFPFIIITGQTMAASPA
ncbi:class I SAM-dependent methyltransferase [Thermodesulfobacteriota bacterium]